MSVSVLAFSAATHCARSYVEYRYACALRYRYVVRGLWLYGRSHLPCLPRVCALTYVARFRFGFLCRDGTCFVSCLLVLSVTARTHDRLFCVYSHRPPYDRMAVCGRARLCPLRSCARRQIRICRRAGFIVVPFTLSDGRSFPARPNDIQDPANSDGRSRPARSNDIRDPAKMSCTACAALLALCVAERERQLLTDRFYHVALHMSIGNFPVDVSAR